MNDMLNKLFPMGHRKLVVSLIGLALSFGLDHFGKLDDNMKMSILALVGIFTGGNVLEHFADALKFLKGTKVGQVIEDAIPGDQGLGAVSQAATARTSEAVDEAHGRIDAVVSKQDDLERKLAVQAQNMAQVVNILNTLRQPAPPRPPTP